MELDFLECGISQLDNYRTHMFETFGKLEILDGTDKNGDEVEEEVIDLFLKFFIKL